jgi:hypothetical protein
MILQFMHQTITERGTLSVSCWEAVDGVSLVETEVRGEKDKISVSWL